MMNMNTKQILPLPSDREKARARFTLWTSVIMLAIYAIASTLYAVIAYQTGGLQLAIMAGMGFVLAISCIIAIRWSRQIRPTGSALLLIAGIIVVFPVASALVKGLGIYLGLGSLIFSITIANQALESKWIARVIPVTIFSGIAAILMDTFDLPGRLQVPPLVSTLSAVILLVGVVAVIYILLRGFSGFSLRIKMTIFFILISVVTAGVITVNTVITAIGQLNRQVGENSHTLARQVGRDIGVSIETEIHLLQNTADQVVPMAEFANAGYEGSATDAAAQIAAINQTWIRSLDTDPLVVKVTKNSTVKILNELQSVSSGSVEILLTDKYGALVAATDRTSNYSQADNAWWQAVYSNGKGAIYIGQLEYVPSSFTWAVTIAVPVYNAFHQVVGGLKNTLEINSLLGMLEEGRIGNTGRSVLRMGDQLLPAGKSLSPADVGSLNSAAGSYLQMNYAGVPSIVSQAPVQTRNPSSTVGQVISNLGWNVIFHQDSSEAFQSVQATTNLTMLITLVVILIAAGLAVYVSQVIARPIRQLITVAEQLATGDRLVRARVDTKDEVGDLASTFNVMADQLNEAFTGLEVRVVERTAEVENARRQAEERANDLQNIGEVSSIIAREQRIDTLLPLITRVISDRFGFYHVGIFLIDKAHRYAMLQASNSEGGQRMLARQHKLELGVGIVGNVAQSRQPRIALDVGADAVFFDNRDLPETRSEMALPLSIRNEIIGVLDVQSTRPGAFSENDASTLSILADQVAVAIDNALLFGKTQQALEEVDALYHQYLSQEWSTFSGQEKHYGYRQTHLGGKPLSALVEDEELREALSKGETVIHDPKTAGAEPAMTVPIILRGQAIGVLNIKSPQDGHQWNEDEINMVKAISDRLALALENARLLQNAQQRAAKERTLGEVSSKISAATQTDAILQAAIEELGRIYADTEIILQIGSGQSEKE